MHISVDITDKQNRDRLAVQMHGYNIFLGEGITQRVSQCESQIVLHYSLAINIAFFGMNVRDKYRQGPRVHPQSLKN